MKRPVQYFTDEYLEHCRQMTLGQKLEFLDSFRTLVTNAEFERKKTKSRLISIKIPEDLLASFRQKSEMAGTAYQTQIKKLMKKWIEEE